MADGIKSIEELRKAQAAAQAQGTSITNYDEWAHILEDFEVAGIQSTGNYAQDLKLHSEVMEQIAQMIEEAQQSQNQQQIQASNKEDVKVDNKASYDKDQEIKANVANATSSAILSDYMKYYHLLG